MKRLDAAKARAYSRVPLREEEIPFVEALGREVRALRIAHGVRLVDLARLALLDKDSLYRIEHGLRRTRRSTLERIVSSLADVVPDEEVDVLGTVSHLVEVAGPALAAESQWQERMLRRARRRHALLSTQEQT